MVVISATAQSEDEINHKNWQNHPKIIAIGETGLDYYRLEGDLEWQRERFRVHIRAARATGKPLIIHTRSASEDTLRIMREEASTGMWDLRLIELLGAVIEDEKRRGRD